MAAPGGRRPVARVTPTDRPIGRTGATLVTTVKNEVATLPALLDSVAAQTRRPDEIVIVDGGSTDGSVACVEAYRAALGIRLVVMPGAGIAAGRNRAIDLARHDIVASTDAGCILDPRWFEEIVRPLEAGESDLAAGWYEGTARSRLERLLVALTYPRLAHVDPATFLPSARSVAFTKHAWERAGRYPEFLRTAEDTLFDENLRRAGVTFAFVPTARVLWPPRKTLGAALTQVYRYSRGDTEAHRGRRRRWIDTAACAGLLVTTGAPAMAGRLGVAAVVASAAWAWFVNKARIRLDTRNLLDWLLGGCVLLLMKYAAVAGHVAGLMGGPPHHVVQEYLGRGGIPDPRQRRGSGQARTGA